jgi:hypothetical protein
MAGAPRGNQNAVKRDRKLTDAMRRILTQNPEEVVAIVKTLIEKAKSGESWAQTLIWDRMDGKVPQDLGIDIDAGPGLIGILAALGKPARGREIESAPIKLLSEVNGPAAVVK